MLLTFKTIQWKLSISWVSGSEIHSFLIDNGGAHTPGDSGSIGHNLLERAERRRVESQHLCWMWNHPVPKWRRASGWEAEREIPKRRLCSLVMPATWPLPGRLRFHQRVFSLSSPFSPRLNWFVELYWPELLSRVTLQQGWKLALPCIRKIQHILATSCAVGMEGDSAPASQWYFKTEAG